MNDRISHHQRDCHLEKSLIRVRAFNVLGYPAKYVNDAEEFVGELNQHMSNKEFQKVERTMNIRPTRNIYPCLTKYSRANERGQQEVKAIHYR